MNKQQIEALPGGTLVKIAKDGKAASGKVGAFKKLTPGAVPKAAVMIEGKIRYIAPERIDYAKQ